MKLDVPALTYQYDRHSLSVRSFCMTELIKEVDGSRGMSRTEHALQSVLDSDVESVRSRLIYALEKLDYKVISDEPLFARRKARGLARYYLAANILDYPTKLTIGLRQISPNATLATFDYVADHWGSVSFEGDRRTLTREAEAIIALATAQTNASACSSCGTKQTNEGRFCRICGQPTIGREPAELEVLRVTAGTRAGQHLVIVGAIWTALSVIASIAFLIMGGGAVGLVGVVLLCQAVFGMLILFWGIQNLSSALSRDASRPTTQPVDMPYELAAKDAAQLPHAPPSVTEGTTNLLIKNPKGRDEDVYSKARDTSPMD